MAKYDREKEAERKRRQRARKSGKPTTIIVQIDDPETWREILTEWGYPQTVSLATATTFLIADDCREHRKEKADELFSTVCKFRTGHIEMQTSRPLEYRLVKAPHAGKETPLGGMDDEQRALAEMIEEAELFDELEERIVREDDGSNPETGEQRWVRGKLRLDQVESRPVRDEPEPGTE